MKNNRLLLVILTSCIIIATVVVLPVMFNVNNYKEGSKVARLVVGVSRPVSFFANPYIVYAINLETGKKDSEKPFLLQDEIEISPDGVWGVYSSRFTDGSRAGSNSNLFLLNIEKNTTVQITDDLRSEYYDPAWSPDGKAIVYVTGGQIKILSLECYFSLDGCKEYSSFFVVNGYSPDWSPDGKWIVYQSEGHVYRTSPKGQETKDLTPNFTGCSSPKWSPTDDKIVFTCDSEIYVLNHENLTIENIVTKEGGKWDTSWSPDGKRVVFVSDMSDFGLGKILDYDGVQSSAVFIVNLDGGDLKKLSPDNDEHILWYSWIP